MITPASRLNWMPSGEKFWLLTTTTLESMTKPLLCTLDCREIFAVKSTPEAFIFSAHCSPNSLLSMSRTSTPAATLAAMAWSRSA